MGPLLAAVLLSAAPEPRAALIWGGATTRPAAERWLATWTKAAAPFEGFHTLAPDYPRIVESAKLPGLKPGFHVVLLGVCALSAVAPRAAYFKAIYAGVYVRKVKVPDDACPTLAPGVAVEHSQSLDAPEGVLTLSQLATPRGALLRATLLSREGAELDTDGFDTPRARAGACFGGFRLDGHAFEVTLCESSRETNTCCASHKVSRLAVVDGKLDRNAAAPVPAPAPVDAGPEEDEEPSCTHSSMQGGFTRRGADESMVLEVCEVGQLDYGGGMVSTTREARLRLEREGKPVATVELGNWSQGWEWGTRIELVGTLPLGKTGRDAVLVQRTDHDEHSSVAEATVYDGELAELWKRDANGLEVSVRGNTLEVTAMTQVGGDPVQGEVYETERFTVTWRNGALVEKRR